ncbi:MAG TPA: hypothetical protein VEJ21_04035 [Acidimicrobiales bacterium]|nr:hypothetical protein [Acidimicrobiales bacterium]
MRDVPALARRWRGQRGRLEVVYATVSDPATGTGAWVHHELVSPEAGPAYVHGWAAVFRTGAEPVLERFGPKEIAPGGVPSGAVSWEELSDATFDPPILRGSQGRLCWDLRVEDGPQQTLWTFPGWAWDRELLPGAQVVPVPSACMSGSVQVDADRFELSPDARGAVAHIYGHGNAERWGWLHGELGGGDVIEIVAAVSRRPGLDRLAPLALVQLRVGGRDWPRDPLLAAPLLRARLGLPCWQVQGTVGRWRLRVTVDIPSSRSVSLGYRDPDGAGATCTNSELADAEILLERRLQGRWETAAHWALEGTAHAEIGTRP